MDSTATSRDALSNYYSSIRKTITCFERVLGRSICALAAVLLFLAAGSTGSVWAQRVSPDILSKAKQAVKGNGLQKKAAPMRKLGMNMAIVYYEYEQFKQESGSESFEPTDKTVRVNEGRVMIDAVAAGNAGQLKADLERLGAEQVSTYRNLVSGLLPIDQIPAMADLSSLRSARIAAMRTNDQGSVVSEGDAAMEADSARIQAGVDGSGTTVGVLSDSYNARLSGPGASAGIRTGDLPPAEKINVLEDLDFGSDEGRGMMELIHDVAPQAGLAFHTAFGGQATFASGIKQLAGSGSDVIVDDIIYFAEPMFQDGIIAQAADSVKKTGVPYFSSAGNAADQSYESAFRLEGNSHDFDPGSEVDTLQKVRLPVGASSGQISLQWTDPFITATGGQAGPDTDLDVQILDKEGNLVTELATDNIQTGRPVEFFGFTNPGTIDADDDGIPDETFQIRVVLAQGPAPDRAKYVYFGGLDILEYDTKSASSFGHANAAGAMAVGAANYQRTPEFGVTPPEPEAFSAKGGVDIYFDDNGNKLSSPQERKKPDIVAPDGTNNTFFGSDIDADGTPNFSGTSAAAPHAAAAAALLLDKNATLSPENVYSALENNTIDMGAQGFDNKTGNGLIQVDRAIETIQRVGPPKGPPLLSAKAGNGWVNLDWEASSADSVDGYNVYRAPNFADSKSSSSATKVNKNNLLGRATTSFVDDGVTNGVQYYYRVTAVDTDSDGGETKLSDADVRKAFPQGLQIAEIADGAGTPGDTVRILGSGFSSTPGGNTVVFETTAFAFRGTVFEVERDTATVAEASESELVTTVPEGVSGAATVTVQTTVNGNTRTAQSAGSFSGLRSGLGGEIEGFLQASPEVHAADLNGDRFKDLLQIGRRGLEWVDLQTFAPGTPIPGAGEPASVFAADLDGDGDQDVLTAGGSSISWHENFISQGGSFSVPKTISSSVSDAQSVYPADLDGDGDQDVLSASSGDNKVAWYQNRGGGDFSGQKVLTSTAVGASAVVAVDLNGDATQDILFVDDNKVAWIDGSNKSAGPTTIASNGGSSVRTAELDGDGDRDVFAVETGDGEVVWYANQLGGAGGFSSANVIASDVSAPQAAFPGDLDGDGDRDLVTAAGSRSVTIFSWYENDGQGGFGDAKGIGRAFDGGADLAVADFDADGALDVVSGTRRVSFVENDEPAPFTPDSLTAAAGSEDGTTTVSWVTGREDSASPDEDLAGYDLYRAPKKFESRDAATRINEAPITNDTPATDTISFTDTTVTKGVQYAYRAIAVDTLGTESRASNQDAVKLDGLVVYPGDTNDDGTVDQNDVMALGSFWNAGGPDRSRTDCGWRGNEAQPWSDNAATYADANGDGEINQGDVKCVGLNWGRSTPGASSTSGKVLAKKDPQGNMKLTFADGKKSTLTPGTSVWAKVAIKGGPSLSGAAFELAFPTEKLTVEKVRPGASMGEGAILEYKTSEESKSVGVGVARKNGTVEKGVVARVKLRVAEGTSGPYELGLKNGAGQVASGETVSLKTEKAQTLKQTPETFSVQGNAPNPVRSRTTIRYALPEAKKVRVTMYDVLGRQVKVLVNERQGPGHKKIEFRPQGLASGTYFYRVEAGDKVKTRRMQIVQ